MAESNFVDYVRCLLPFRKKEAEGLLLAVSSIRKGGPDGGDGGEEAMSIFVETGITGHFCT